MCRSQIAQECGCHEECGCNVETKDAIELLELTKQKLLIRIKSIDRKISQLKEHEAGSGSN